MFYIASRLTCCKSLLKQVINPFHPFETSYNVSFQPILNSFSPTHPSECGCACVSCIFKNLNVLQMNYIVTSLARRLLHKIKQRLRLKKKTYENITVCSYRRLLFVFVVGYGGRQVCFWRGIKVI